MSTLPVSELPQLLRNARNKSATPWPAVLACSLAILSLPTIWSTIRFLWALWTTDALKSVGMMIPVVSLVLVLRVWRSLRWETEGTWWGLAVLVATIAAVRVRDQSILVFVISPQWSIYVPPHSLVVLAYVSGIVLLFGGTRLFRAALFPILLLWFVNPVPHVFNVLVDLPLQRASAHLARGFAMALGQPLSRDQLRLMFTPEFGMFIAPGCNGIRGAVTMGLVALVAGYLYRFRWYAHVLVVVGAILLGYVFNFIRLFVLVLYYLVALRFTSLQNKAEMADYIIGALLFLIATLVLFWSIRRLGSSARRPPAPETPSPTQHSSALYARLAVMAAVVLFGFVSLGRALSRPLRPSLSKTVMGDFPNTIGNYTLLRSWNENLTTGPLIFHWAEYGNPNGGPHVAIGVSPVLGSHDTLICHSARGEDPLWHSQLTLLTADNVPISFSASFYNDDATQYVEATTLCNGSTCGEYVAGETRFGLVYSRPTSQALWSQDPQRPIPVLLRVETVDTALPADYARQQMTGALAQFLTSANLDALTLPYRRP